LGASLAEGLSIHGVTDKAEQKSRITAIMQAVGLDMAMTERYPHELSGGQQRRMGLARILLLRPKIVILDEPTAGVDVELRQSLWQFISRLNHDGHTIVLTTHYLEEAEALCQRIAMLKQGKVVALDTTTNLLSRFGGAKKQNGEAADLEDVFVHIMSGNAA
jgi:ABC-2 type transport system ATP-binding protein